MKDYSRYYAWRRTYYNRVDWEVSVASCVSIFYLCIVLLVNAVVSKLEFFKKFFIKNNKKIYILLIF